MVPKYHPAPLSGGDRKALNKELGKAHAMANILASRSAEMRPKGDADDTVVGFVLAKPNRLERFHHENHAGKAVISRRYLARQARALIEFAKSTTNPKLAAVLVERAADFKEKADEKMPAPRS